MNYIQAIVMGIVQGATEFLPVSSSGHLAIFGKLFGMNEPDLTFEILLHLGTLLAVFVVYFRDIKRLIVEGFGIIADACVNVALFLKNSVQGDKEPVKYRHIVNSSYRKFVMLIIVSTIPTAIIGLLMSDIVELVSKNLLIVGICLLLTSCLLLLCDMIGAGTKKPKNITYTNAFVIGICQGAATLPGISRSGTTITACRISGFDKKLAVKYSFIMSIPAVLGAAVLELKDFFAEISSCNYLGQYIVGTIVAALTGFLCMKLLMLLVKKNKFKYFAAYCVVAGIASIVIHFVK